MSAIQIISLSHTYTHTQKVYNQTHPLVRTLLEETRVTWVPFSDVESVIIHTTSNADLCVNWRLCDTRATDKTSAILLSLHEV